MLASALREGPVLDAPLAAVARDVAGGPHVGRARAQGDATMHDGVTIDWRRVAILPPRRGEGPPAELVVDFTRPAPRVYFAGPTAPGAARTADKGAA